MQRSFPVLIALTALAAPQFVRAQGFAALISPPRFEVAAKPGKTLRNVIEVSNRSTATAKYLIHTADWTLSPDFSVSFHDDLQPGRQHGQTPGTGRDSSHTPA